ncbi:helix-turn-helix transcriptional regulator [Bradyrhizobium sp. AUGA SZCCT0240]|uniref:helix-turn-helix transcriptional regulator n=1 Tax=unclassified Bradyrhizobium TaxID=2631580 RepID=UPI001BA7E077|nr:MULTISPECIES: helix-turn-helix transcriptional regulator [unclassified Bradyrhizobium]MBR1200224.1 helix-turn-helix transcriptional regulator [Bradyrhizobium sp. AUGA SZCCT0158]MBR1244456.1 helix-turn-helix transcriptional regulator [Bradyrhizobium sp. AUGA SZCCT0274]MBR1256647.1 helix-turn-helix transcriptional regulator [Bradyrhizobium sp. AUGA SZCCT0240]
MIDLEGVSAQALSDTIGAIYDCALDPQLWPETCRKIADLCESTGGGICVHDMRHVQNDQLFVFGYQPEFLEKLGSQYAQSPMAAADIVASVGDVNILSTDRQELLESRFYRDVLAPFALTDMIWFPALRTGGRMASMHASRKDQAPHYQQLEIGLFKLLSPHVCRALTISDALDIRTLRSEMLEKTLDVLAAGVFLAARDGRVVYMNEAAERQVRAGTSIRILNNRLDPVDPAASAALSMAIDRAAREDDGGGQRSLAIPSGTGAGYIATLLPVQRGQRADIVAPFAASVAIFMQDPLEAPMMPGEAFARLHKLTGGELRVLLALAQGLGAKEAADMLGISEPTVRTHLQHMFAKTHTLRQADLLRLLQASTPAVRAP